MKASLSLSLALLTLAACGGSEGADYTDEIETALQEAATSTPVANAAMKSGAYIEYSVKGDIEVSDREEEVVLCSTSSDGFKAHTIGEWNFSLDAAGEGPGKHNVRFMVASAPEFESVRTRGRDHRFYGDGTMELEDAGRDNFGLAAVKVSFSAQGLVSDPGYEIDVEGSFFCAVM
ncbi:MAG: hypothetical protein JSW51_14475 [Gemmatimonadota bacterium]|nr:MAG: hypothetical protein JSW51_14475 [Gemmatimonadota bacterium]